MKTVIDYQLQPGTHSLKYYHFYTPGLRAYSSKAKVIEALNLGLAVYRLDKIMKYVHKWNNETETWVKIK
jgi:hypothetical protein